VGRSTTGDVFTLGTTTVSVGNTAQDIDFKIFMGATAYVLFDVGNGAVDFGVDGTGVDAKFFGDTASAYMLWDMSADALVFAGLAKIDIGATGTPLVLTAGTPIFELFSTCASTNGSTSAEPLYVKSTMTGAGGVGGRSRFHMYANVALGSWANALKAYTEFGASGSVTGLASALCAEMVMPAAAAPAGTYSPLEVELYVPASNTTGGAVSMMYFNVDGDSTAKTSFNTNGYFMHLGAGFVDTASGILDAITSDATPVFEYRLRILAAGVPMYIPVSTNATFAG